MEQNHVKASDKVAVVGDGKLGLLIARAVLSSGIVDSLTIFGRHSSKMELVDGATRLIASPAAESMYAGTFDVCIDATGTSEGNLSERVVTCLPISMWTADPSVCHHRASPKVHRRGLPLR